MKHLALALIFCFTYIETGFAQNEGDQFFAEGLVHEIRLDFLQTGYWDSLVANKPSETYMRCNVTIDDTLYPDAGVRFKGNSSYNGPGQKKPFKIDLEEYVDEQTHDGLKQLSLNNGFKDPSFLREKLVLDFMNQHGIAAPRCTFTRLYLNNEYWGLYTAVEDIGKTFLKQRFDNNDGNLFKGDPHGSLTWKGDQQSNYAGDYELKTNEGLNDWSDLIALLDALNNSAGADLPTALGSRLHLDGWYGYWVVHSMFVNLDSYVGSGHNYYLYHNEDTDQFEFIAWDENEAFGNFKMNLTEQQIVTLPYTHIPQPFSQRPLMNRLLQDASLKQAYIDRYCSLLPYFSNEAFDARIDSLADLIRPHVYEDTKKTFSNLQFEQNLSQDVSLPSPQGQFVMAGLKSFISNRRAALVQQVDLATCVTSTSNATESEGLAIYPNPSSGRFFIEAKGEPVISMELFNLNGQLLQTSAERLENTVREWQVDAPAGLYFLKAVLENGQMKTAKLVMGAN
ncbi:MAG: CotH kinase family protein [Bacteroidetes bacterium]|nr:CotH kinase family protein [Bacteroidota bacterium]